jgi:3-oxoadipate enol-lactonase/4-carboxymuconolactone decarboxylase
MAFLKNRNDITIHYKWINQNHAKNIVLINSLVTNFTIWNEVVERIKGQFNVLLFDKRGHGLSSTHKGEISIDDYADDVIDLMDNLSIEKTYVLGLSIGGMITYSLASRYSDRFIKLIFSNTGAKLGTLESWKDRVNAIEKGGITSMSSTIMERWLSPKYRTDFPAETAGYTNMLERNTILGYTQACLAIGNANFNPVLEKIKQPAMFIGGSADIGTTPELVKANAEKLNAERVEIIDGVGHLPCIEAPKEVAELISDFCKEELSLYEQGMKTRRSVLGNAHVDRAEANKTDFDKDFQTYIIKNAWGSIWSRPHLTKRERSMITIAVLSVLGHYDEVSMHIRATQNTGATEEDVKEVLLHIGVYAGVPITNHCMKIAKQVYQQLKKSEDVQ